MAPLPLLLLLLLHLDLLLHHHHHLLLLLLLDSQNEVIKKIKMWKKRRRSSSPRKKRSGLTLSKGGGIVGGLVKGLLDHLNYFGHDNGGGGGGKLERRKEGRMNETREGDVRNRVNRWRTPKGPRSPQFGRRKEKEEILTKGRGNPPKEARNPPKAGGNC